jgi:hypothetical protein
VHIHNGSHREYLYCYGIWRVQRLPSLIPHYSLPLYTASQFTATATKSSNFRSSIHQKGIELGWICLRNQKSPSPMPRMVRGNRPLLLSIITPVTDSTTSQSKKPHPFTSKNLDKHQQSTHNQMKPPSERVLDYQRSAASYGPGQRPSAEIGLKQWTDEWRKLAKKI